MGLTVRQLHCGTSTTVPLLHGYDTLVKFVVVVKVELADTSYVLHVRKTDVLSTDRLCVSAVRYESL